MAVLDEMVKAEIEAGLSAIKASQIVNGGAAAALLAVLAEGMKQPQSQLAALTPALSFGWFCFMMGLLATIAAHAARYFSQALFTTAVQESAAPRQRQLNRFGALCRAVAIATALMSIAAFFVGSFVVYDTFAASGL